MSFWNKKNTPQIPPVEQRSRGDQLVPPNERGPNRSPNRSPSPNIPSRYQNTNDDDPYASAPSSRNVPDRYRNMGNSYGRPVDADAARAQLFGGAGAGAAAPPERRPNRWQEADYRPQNQEEEDEDVEGIKKDIRTTKQDSVTSTRNALRIARDAEENARSTLQRLGEQSEKLASTEHYLDKSKVNASRAEDDAKKLKTLNHSIFRPSFTMNKDKKRMEQEAKVQARFEEERNAREMASQGIRDSQNRIAEALDGGRRQGTKEETLREKERKRYQFEATQSDDEMEDEIDDNLRELDAVSSSLKRLATAQGDEISGQLKRLGGMGQKVDNLDAKVRSNTYKLDKIK